MLAAATQHLIDVIRNPSSTPENMQAAAQALMSAAASGTPDQANAALAELAGHLALDDLSRGSFLALLCGALVEKGCDPSPLSQSLIPRLHALLASSARLADACRARLPQPEAEGEDHDPAEAFEQSRQQLRSEMPAEHAAWEALTLFWRPGIAVFSVSPSARAAARGLCEPAAKIADHHEAGHWLRLMLSVLDNEPVLVIEPNTRVGLLARMSGVVDNFQLHVLLMDTFPRSGFFARRRVSGRVADVARGLGPQQTGDTVAGVWNLYSWKGITPGLTLPDPKDYAASDHWIWGEGMPDDIPVFEGRRVILLGPPSYHRTWGCARMFSKLPASLIVERALAKEEVTDWLQRMTDAKAATTG